MRDQKYNSFVGICLEISEAFLVMLRERPVVVGSAWLFLFIVLLGISWSLDLVPKFEDDDALVAGVSVATSSARTLEEIYTDGTPIRIVIDAIDVDAIITTPASADLPVLDAALLKGVVHYPG
ncbi:MAG: hypothetical protein AAB460_03355, partial [Patescibacteria group bacterium]